VRGDKVTSRLLFRFKNGSIDALRLRDRARRIIQITRETLCSLDPV
jgi:hypothetical protein